MNLRNIFNGIVAMTALALLASCVSTTSLTDVWKEPGYQGMAKKVVVVGLLKDQAVRNLFEDEFVAQLKARKIDAVASYTLVPFAQLGNRDAALAAIKKAGADSVLVSRLVDRKTVQSYVAGTAMPYPNYYNSWSNYYAFTYSPSYVVEDEFAYVESNLYQSSSEKLVWSARSETWIVKNSQELIKPFVKVVFDKLVSDKLI